MSFISRLYGKIYVWLYIWWNPREYKRLDLDKDELDKYFSLSIIALKDVFNKERVTFVTKNNISIEFYDPPNFWDAKLGENIEYKLVKTIDIKLEKLSFLFSINPKLEATKGYLDYLREKITFSFKEEIDSKKWTHVFIKGWIKTQFYKEQFLDMKRWMKWINWFFMWDIYDPIIVNESIMIRQYLLIGGYNDQSKI